MVAWSPLGSRIGSLPTVLAGPILRTVSETSVTVWLALKESATVTLTIHESDAATAAAIGTATTPATKIGTKLYIVAVTASIPARLALGRLYFYRLSFATASGTKNLVQATGRSISAFAYANYQLPSLLLPPGNIEQVRFAVGSCRKIHTNSADALALLDETLAANVNSPSARPQILMLGGDQIYADEVADALLMMLTDAGLTLLGYEDVPLTSTTLTTLDQLPPTTRTKRIKQAGFTTVDTRSHLMGLGEYLAMYLFVWSDVLWLDPPSGLPVVPTVDDVLRAVVWPDEQEAARNLMHEMTVQFASLFVTYSTLPKVRRALANIATYMILDDHEITDDFNMQRRFCDGVYGNPLGMRVVQNGLIAYAVCQHWGNCPQQFTGTAPGARLLNLFAGASRYGDIAANPDLQKIVGLHTPAQLRARQQSLGGGTPYAVYHDNDSLTYNYTIEGAAFQLIVTDTRTWRAFPRPGLLAPPDQIEESQLAVQIGATSPLGNRLLMVLVTTNMPPCPSFRQAGRDAPRVPVVDWYDFEDFYDAWHIEQLDFARTVVALTKKVASGTAGSPFANRVVLLSGDVHSSQATRLGYWATQQVGDSSGSPTSAQVVFAQIVASALLNENENTHGEHLVGYDYLPSIKHRALAQRVLRTEGLVGWNPKTMTEGTVIGTREVRSPAAGVVLIPVTRLVKFDPGRPTQTTRSEAVGAIWNKTPIKLRNDATPHYRYRIDYLTRAAAGRVFSVAPPGATPLANQAAASITYVNQYVHGGVEQIGRSNLGDLTFARGSGHPDWIAKFLVRWGEGSTNNWARFDVSLDPNDPAYPQLADPR